MLNGRFQIFLRKHQIVYSNPETGLTYNVIVQCDPLTGWAQYVPGDVDNTWYQFTDFIEESEKLSLTWDKTNSGNSTNSETNQDGSNYDKGVTSDLMFFDKAYQFIYDWLLSNECQILNCVEVKIVDLIAENTYRLFEIKNDNIELAPVDEPCQMHIKLREQDTTWGCIHKTFIWDNWQNWFNATGTSTKEHPCFLTCIEPRPRLVQSVRMALLLFYHSNPGIVLISFFTGADIKDDTRRILNANRFVDAPFVRTYIENVAGKCGMEMDTIFDEGQHWQNLCLYYPQAGYMHESDTDDVTSPSLVYHYDNRWLITIAELLDKLKLVFAAEWYVTPNNTIVFKYTKDLINLLPIYDFTAVGAEPIYELRYTFNGDKKPAYGRYEYQTDGSDLASQEMSTLYNDIVDYDGPNINPMLEGDLTKNFEFAPTGFVRDGRAQDYMRLLLEDGKTGAFILIGLFAALSVIFTVTSAAWFPSTAGAVATAIALVVMMIEWSVILLIKYGNLKDIFVDGSTYTGAVRLTSEQVLTPRLLLWDGDSIDRAKTEMQSIPLPNTYYNTEGTAYNVVNSIGQDNPGLAVYNYPLYFDSFFKDNLFDSYHDEIDNPLKSKESHQEAKWYVDLCTEMLNLFGVFENQYAVIGKVVKLEQRDGYAVYVRIGNIAVDYDQNRINLKGVVLRRTGTATNTGNISNISTAIQLLGFNGNITTNPVSYDNSDFRLAILDTGATMMRYPGGTVANSFEWQTGTPSLADLFLLYDTVGCDISFNMNMITRTLADQINMLQTANGLGIPIKYVEMGNEFNSVNSEAMLLYGSPEAYAAECAVWRAAISALFPACKFGIPGGNKPNAQMYNWNDKMLAANPDAFLVWHYHNEEYYVFSGVVDVNLVGQLIDAKKADAFPGIDASRIWVTEFNLRNDDNSAIIWANDYQHGLAARVMMQKFYNMGCPVILLHNIVGAGGNGAIFADGVTTYLTPTGTAIKDFISTT